MHEVLVNRLGGLSLPRKSVVRLTDRPDMTLDVYRGRKTTMQHVSFCEKKFWQNRKIHFGDLKPVLVDFGLFFTEINVWMGVHLGVQSDLF